MKAVKRRALALGLASALLFTLLLLQYLIEHLPLQQPPDLVVREVNLSAPPPPPPPPPAPQQQTDSAARAVNLDVSGAGPRVELGEAPVDTRLKLPAPQAPGLDSQPDWQQALNVDWDAFGLAELDQLPQLISSPKTRFPPSLTRRGIRKATVELDVLIDENGRVTLRSVRANPYPELQPLIDQVVRKSRFTSPTKEGQPVRAVFTWPVEFSQ